MSGVWASSPCGYERGGQHRTPGGSHSAIRGVCLGLQARHNCKPPPLGVGYLTERARTVSLTRSTSTAIAVYISDTYHFTTIYEVLASLDAETSSNYPLVKTEEEALALIQAWLDKHPGE